MARRGRPKQAPRPLAAIPTLAGVFADKPLAPLTSLLTPTHSVPSALLPSGDPTAAPAGLEEGDLPYDEEEVSGRPQSAPKGKYPTRQVFDEPMPEDSPDDLVEACVKAESELATSFKRRAEKEDKRFKAACDSEFWVALCFESRQQKEEFLHRLKLNDLGDKYVNGLEAAARMKIDLASPPATWVRPRLNKDLRALVREDVSPYGPKDPE